MVLGGIASLNLVLVALAILYIFLWLHNKDMAMRLTQGLFVALVTIFTAVFKGLFTIIQNISSAIGRLFK